MTGSFTRSFTAAQIATGYGRLITSMDDVYAVLNHMTGDNLYTHQIPRAIEAARPAMVAQHPWLLHVDHLADEALLRHATPEDAMSEVKAVLNGRHGIALPLVPLTRWEHRDAIEELCDLVGAERVYVIPTGVDQ